MKTEHARRLVLIALGGILIAGTSACSRDPEPAPIENSVEDQAPRETPTPETTPTPEPTPVAITNVTAPAAAPIAPDEQMLDDATATGMTSHTARDDEGSDAATAMPANRQ